MQVIKMSDERDAAGMRAVLDAAGDAVDTRYLGRPDDILDEVGSAGFQLLDWRIKPRTSEVGDMDDLLVWAAK